MKITIKTYKDGNEVSSLILAEGTYRIGRSEFCDIVLEDQHVSRSHIEIRVTESAVYMTNMSTGGKVSVNGKALETAELNDADEIKIGDFKLVFFHGEAESEAAENAVDTPDGNPDGNTDDGAADDAGAGDVLAGGERDENMEMGNGGFEFNGEEDSPLEDNVAEGGFGLEDPLQSGSGDPLGGFGSPQSEGSLALQEMPLDSDLDSDGPAGSHAETQLEIKPIVAKLVFSEGPRAGEELFIESFEVTIGRSKRADIFLDDERLSRIHAKITRVGMGYRLIDMDSRNGTYVNGMRILEHPLSSFDELQIGDSKIKFLIHDVLGGSEVPRGGPLAAVGEITATGGFEATRSIQLHSLPADVLQTLKRPTSDKAKKVSLAEFKTNKTLRNRVLLSAVLIMALGLLFLPGEKQEVANGDKAASQTDGDPIAKVQLPPTMPREYLDLTPEQQRQIEGYYNSAVLAAQQGRHEEAVKQLQTIHSNIPYYKNSRELLESYLRRVKEKQIAAAQRKAVEDDKQDLIIYLDEGLDYLKAGDFDRAANSFNSAIIIDPKNPTAIKGLKAAEARVKSLDAIPKDTDPDQEKQKIVKQLFNAAVNALLNKSYQEAIDDANKIKNIKLSSDSKYVQEAQAIIDRARMRQKEEFEPFLIQAKEKYAEGDYNSSRDLCEEMIARDPAYSEAGECVLKAKKQLNRLAKEAYTYGYILESMNRIEEAKQYWNRAKNYVRQGDDYYEKVLKKLDYYQ